MDLDWASYCVRQTENEVTYLIHACKHTCAVLMTHLNYHQSPFAASLSIPPIFPFCSLTFSPLRSSLTSLPLSLRLFPLSYLHCDVTPSNKHVFLKEGRTEAPFILRLFLCALHLFYTRTQIAHMSLPHLLACRSL